MTNSLTIFTKAALMLAEADTIQKAKELKSLALTMADFAKRKGMGQEAIQHCRSYALEAERRMGEMLATTDRAKPGPSKKDQLPSVTDLQPTLKEIGLTKRESAEAQALAALPQDTFESVKSGKTTRKDIRRKQKRADHAALVERVKKERPAVKPKGPFDVVLADPPWRYEHCEANNREIENQYPTASLDEIFAHAPNAKDDCILFLWATAPKLAEAMQVIERWGFVYRSGAVWDKEVIGMGYWFRIQHEHLLVAVKGAPKCPPESERVSSVFRQKRGKHSAKPAAVQEWIERAYPLAVKCEMYCRERRAGWAAWGNEV